MPTQTVDLRAQVVNIKVTRGDSWVLAVTFPASLVGKEVRGQVRESAESTTSTELIIEMIDEAAGRFGYGQLSAAEGVYDIEIANTPGGPGRTWIKGRITAEQDVTRA